MSEPFIGEIRMFAGNFAPRSWALCDGQLLAVAQNDALFSLLGTTYGGDGRTSFGLPDLRGRIPVHAGSGTGLSTRRLGERGGSERAELTVSHLPSHSHLLHATGESAGRGDPSAALRARSATPAFDDTGGPVPMAGDVIAGAGGSQPHPNIQPFLCVNFIMALFGIYPSRN